MSFYTVADFLWAQNTNVVKFFALLKKDDFHEQLCYYQVRSSYFKPDSLLYEIYSLGSELGLIQALFRLSFNGGLNFWTKHSLGGLFRITS